MVQNCIKFKFPGGPGSLTLIDMFSHFEVHVDAPYDVCFHLCPKIQRTLLKGILEATKTLRYDKLIPEVAFLCNHENTPLHLAFRADSNYWICKLKPETVYKELNEGHLLWDLGKGNVYDYTQCSTMLTDLQSVLCHKSVVQSMLSMIITSC